MPDITVCSIEGCGKPHEARGWCNSHYTRWRRHGDPVYGRVMHGDKLKFVHDVALVWGRDECLFWPFSRMSNGYCKLTVNGIDTTAHRYICEKVNGPPQGEKNDAAHSCGNGKVGCISPNHLRWATRQENMSDTVLHGTRLVGERHGNAKLTNKQAIEIIALGKKMTHEKIAALFGVSRPTVSMIISGKRRSGVMV